MKSISYAAATAYLLAVAGGVGGQESGRQIFAETEAIRAQAEAANAPLLSPQNYLRGVEDYDKAWEDFAEGRNPNRIQSRLADAVEHFQAAIDTTAVAQVSFRSTIEARTAANEAEAFRLSGADWAAAEKELNRAARTLEKGDLNGAGVRSDAALELYRAAELNAIKARHLAEARRLIADADQANVGRYAPATLNRARALLQEAESALEGDRYSVEEPVTLAARASYEARHAMRLAGALAEVANGQRSMEDVILEWEIILTAIADAARVEADLSVDYGVTRDQVVTEIRELQQLENIVAERERQISGLEEEIRELDDRLGGANAERTALVLRLEEQARVREQFAQVDELFAEDEAIVLRDGDNVIVRLVGLTFASGSSSLQTDAQPLMDKVRRAINVFPRCDLTVEGHTDSAGRAGLNLELSEARATAVRDYMIETMEIPGHRIQAVGFGDTRPIANNETAAGRARNRRIDLLITPKLTSSSF